MKMSTAFEETCHGAAPATGVVIIELHPLEQSFVVPLSKHNYTESKLLHIRFQLLDLLRVKFLLAVRYYKGAIV